MTISKILKEYEPDNTIWSEETCEINKLKNIVFNELSESDRRIILLYAELQSLRKVGKTLGVSSATVQHKIKTIREKIYALL